MIDFIERFLLRWTKATPKDTYAKLLEQFDQPHATMVNLPEMLVNYWAQIEPLQFEGVLSVRDMMYIDISPRHENIGELVRLMTAATGALVEDDDETLMEISKSEFAVNRNMTLDDYFGGMGSLTFIEGVRAIKYAVENHGRNIENLNPSYHARVLNRMYNDILYVTRVIVAQLKEETN